MPVVTGVTDITDGMREFAAFVLELADAIDAGSPERAGWLWGEDTSDVLQRYGIGDATGAADVWSEAVLPMLERRASYQSALSADDRAAWEALAHAKADNA